MAVVVIDTNVLISALLGHGKPRSLVTRLLAEHAIVTSRDMLTELADVLSREKFLEIKRAQVNAFLSILLSKASVVRVEHHLNVVAEDPDDNIVLSTALKEKADYIVTGDKHLLNLKEFRGIKVLTVKGMLDLLKGRMLHG
ncbi:MAG: putative toxin-antitoxin system toxin component, PIN family [Candidatus Bathyarchaeia archaeon]|jgi:putative PIN family toxin of toxin-antitoxin system